MGSADAGQGRPNDERRRFRRFLTALTVHINRDNPALIVAGRGRDRSEQFLTLKLRDFSLGGVRGDSHTPLLLGEWVTVSLSPLGTRPRVFLTGRVTHCQKVGHRFNVGIEFCQIRGDVENSPWLRIPELFYVARGEPMLIQ